MTSQSIRSLLSEIDFRRCRHVITENARVIDAKEALRHVDLARFVQLMYQSHDSLNHDYEVSCRELNLMVGLARNIPGVYGARMTGGGFGGCTINLVEREVVPEFKTSVAREYEKLTDLSPQIFASSAAGGASHCRSEIRVPCHSPERMRANRLPLKVARKSGRH